MRKLTVWLGVAAVALIGCGRQTTSKPADDQRAAAASTPGASSPDGSNRPKIVALGDSLTAGRGLLEAQAYPALLQEKLDEDGYAWDVVNAGVSGDTTAAGLQRFDWALQPGDVRILILELGANDGLRGLPVDEMRKNLAEIIERARSMISARFFLISSTGRPRSPSLAPSSRMRMRTSPGCSAQSNRCRPAAVVSPETPALTTSHA